MHVAGNVLRDFKTKKSWEYFVNGLFFQVELVVTETDAYALSDQQHIKKLKEEQKLKRLSSRRSSFIAESATDFDKKIETIVSHLNTQL